MKTLIILPLIALAGCSFLGQNESSHNDLVSEVDAKWFLRSPHHTLIDQDGKASPHLFFDVLPEVSPNGRAVNVIITTPEGSAHSYGLDLNSGQRFYEHSFCSQKDVWNQYGGSINKPNFSVGIVPGKLDQLGDPQKIIIFGLKRKELDDLNLQYRRVKLIGGFVLQTCKEGNCVGKENWDGRLVWLGIDPENKSTQLLNDISDFQKKIDWSEVKATLENMNGLNTLGTEFYPSTRIGQLIPFEEAMAFSQKRSISLDKAEAGRIQASCISLYERLYKEVGVEREEDKPARTIEELKIKIQSREKLSKSKKPIGFAARLVNFTKRYSQEMASCEKLVYHGNVNEIPDKFWFLSYMGLFYRLNHDGYYFDCKKKSWQKNSTNDRGIAIFDLKEGIKDCSDRDIDMAMDYLPNFLTSLKNSGDEYYKFIDYDMHSFGTHRKMYSWIKVKTKRFQCSDDLNETLRREIKVFPEDVSWKHRDTKDIEDEMKIIY